MKAFLAVKYHGARDRTIVERLTQTLESVGLSVVCFVRDFENYGENKFPASEMMCLAFSLIDKSDIVIVELSEKGVGLGIEAGYAYAKGKQVITIAKKGSDISETLRGISKHVILYNSDKELVNQLKKLLNLSAG